MAKYIFTNKAKKDLKNIWEYTIEKWSENQADKYYNQIIDNCSEIANNPKIGKNYQNIADELKGYKSGKHIIFYKRTNMKENEVEIIRILHSSMDLKNRIKD